MHQLDAPHTVTIRLTTKMTRVANNALYKLRNRRANYLFVVGSLGMLTSLFASAAALFMLVYIKTMINADQQNLASLLHQPHLAQAVQALNDGPLRGAVLKLLAPEYTDTIESICWVTLIAPCYPAFVIVLFFYLQRKGTDQPDHTLEVSLGSENLIIDCGGTRIVHAWQSIRSIRFDPLAKGKNAVITVELDYGAVHRWPQLAFADAETYLMTGHLLGALRLAPTSESAGQ